jgi:hypothetical protein
MERNISLRFAITLMRAPLNINGQRRTRVRLWELQLQSNNMTRLSVLRTEKPADAKKYVEDIGFVC